MPVTRVRWTPPPGRRIMVIWYGVTRRSVFRLTSPALQIFVVLGVAARGAHTDLMFAHGEAP
jgi:hypothetical protein